MTPTRWFASLSLLVGIASHAIAQGSIVVGWGYNSAGQTATPAGLNNAVAVAGGIAHSIALRANGTVHVWGGGSVLSIPAGLSSVSRIAAGAEFCLALKSDGTVVGWGSNGSGQVNIPVGLAGVISIAGGGNHSVAAKADGSVAAWGSNSNGQTTIPGGLAGVRMVAAGFAHCVAAKTDGTVAAWGFNDDGQSTVPGGLTNVIAVAAGGNHSLALRADGTVVAWGSNGSGESNVPAGLSGIVAISAGFMHSQALKSDGTVVAWGLNNLGQSTPRAGLAGVFAIASGSHHNVAAKSNGIPTADAGVDQVLTCTGMLTTVALDGSASSDPEAEVLTYKWSKQGLQLGTGSFLLASLEHGVHVIDLEVTDPWGAKDTDSVVVEIKKKAATMTFNSPTPLSGKNYVGTVTLADPAPVGGVTLNLSSNNPNVGVASSMTIIEGASSGNFGISVAAVDATQTAHITAEGDCDLAGSGFTANKARLQRIDPIKPSLVGGTSGNWGVALNGLAGPSGINVELGKTLPSYAVIPAKVKVLAGKSVERFKVEASPVNVASYMTIWAKLDGFIRLDTLEVRPAVLRELQLAASSVVGGLSVHGNAARLLGIAGPAGVVITLTSSHPAIATVPPNVTIGSGKTVVTFKIVTRDVGALKVVTITATGNGVQKSAILNVQP